jgi:hypothetical protein
MGSENLVCTIKKVEPHQTDPTSNGQPDPWDVVADEFSGLSQRLKATYRKVADEDGPTEEQILDAISTLKGAWEQVAGAVTSAIQDPEMREQLKSAAGSLAIAVGTTVSELNKELKRTADADEQSSEAL